MSRVVSQTLLDAIQNQQGETILRVKTWLNLAAYNAAPTVPEQTWQTNKFKIEGTEAEAALISETNDYTVSDFTVFLIERGVSISGVEYVTQSGLYFVSKFEEKAGRINIKGSSFPDQKIVIDGDDTYENVITAFCDEIGKTAVFKDTGAAWLSYQFLPAGKQIILNKAERFLNLIRQKYLIQCYERSPKELVFYHATTEQSAWKDIIYNDSTLILAASSGSHEIARSADGLAYTKTDAPHFTNAVAYSPTLDLFVAVGNEVAMSSPDGVTWTTRTIGSGNWTGITWDTTLAKFIAVRSGASAISADGINWTFYFQSTYDHIWDAQSAAESTVWTAITWSPELSLFVAVARNGTNRVMSSPDGITWTARSTSAYSWNSIAWSPELSLFVAIEADGAQKSLTSPDGITWTERSTPTGNWLSVIFANSMFIALAFASNKAITSTDGINWTERTTAASANWTGLAWSPSLSLFAAVGNGVCMTSPDGITWTSRTPAEANYWLDITWSPELSLFVAVARNGTNRVMSSPDGITWTARSAAEANEWYAITWSPELSLFVAVARNGTNRVMSSPDGITWTARSAAEANEWYAITWSPELSLFVAVAGSGTNRVMRSDANRYSLVSIATQAGTLAAVGVSEAYTSANGSSWTSRTIPAGTYNKIIYADSLFVAVGASKCATSPDGITWTERTIPAGTYTALAYSPTLDLFLAMGDNLAATSPDGITWTSRTAPADQAWQAVTWADDLAQFIAVSSDGDNRIASSTDGINWQILTAQADYSLSYFDGPTSSILHGTNTVHYISRDESSAVNTEGDTSYPAWNLGYLESTASAPATNTDPFYKFFLQKAPLRLDITDGDRIHFEPSWTLDPTLPIDAMVTIIETFDSTKSPAWYQEIRSLALFDSVEGGSLPSTIERVAAYTPLVSSGFSGNLTPEVNNLQALAEAVDRLSISGTPPPTTTAANDFQVGDGAGAWVKKTLAQTITILRTSLDSIYAAVNEWHSDILAISLKNPPADADSFGINDVAGGNVKKRVSFTVARTYMRTLFDTLYATIVHSHAASDITSGTMATARLGSGTANSSTYLRGDQTYATPKGYQLFLAHGLNGTVPASSTYYLPIAYFGVNATAFSFTIARAGTIKNLSFRLNGAQPASGSLVITVNKNGSNTTLQITLTSVSSIGTHTDTVNSFAVAAGDTIVVEAKNNAIAASGLIGAVSFELEYNTT
jgi:hypothetical protein